MSYADTIQQILSDGRWHCVLDLIAETGLSARNRISELNKEHEEKYAKTRYIGEKCKLERCQHKSDLYMYKLNTGVVSEELVFSVLSLNSYKRIIGHFIILCQSKIKIK